VFLFVSDCVQWREYAVYIVVHTREYAVYIAVHTREYAVYIVVHTRETTRYGSYTVMWRRSEKYLMSEEGSLKFIDDLLYLGVEK
jgi:hypothetical protein